jgi:hypothetical protein
MGAGPLLMCTHSMGIIYRVVILLKPTWFTTAESFFCRHVAWASWIKIQESWKRAVDR